MRSFAVIEADSPPGRGRDRFRSAAYHLRSACDVTAPKGRGTARLLGIQAAGCPASPSSSETRCLSASRLLIVVIDPMCSRSSTETNCVSPIDSARECALRIPREARSIASATFVCSCALGMAFASAFARHATISLRKLDRRECAESLRSCP